MHDQIDSIQSLTRSEASRSKMVSGEIRPLQKSKKSDEKISGDNKEPHPEDSLLVDLNKINYVKLPEDLPFSSRTPR